ncbi:hypothetical protein [Sporosarcina obsidiansis]|uniref:hypothetical protein n=1 Tax=Sporosarcina obsidiansis TaxID=2660748 RepID=UPI00129AD901|nr:hypothetical protein [Sporosarcina obsidiansis]
MKSILSLLLIVSFFILQLTNDPYVHFIVDVYIFLYVITSLPYIKGTTAKITIGLLGMTILLLIGKKDFFTILMEGASTNLSIVCIFLLTPLLGIPVKAGDYLKTLDILLSKLKNNVYLIYAIFLFLTHIFSVILNIGSIIINLHLMNSTKIQSKRLKASILNRGYTTTTIWSPYLGIMALVVSQLKIDWSTLAFYTLGYAAISLVVAFLVDLKLMKLERERIMVIKTPETCSEEPIKGIHVVYKMLELFLLLSLSMGLVLLVEKYTSLSMVLSISLVAILFPIVWCTVRGCLVNYKKEFLAHATKTVPNMQSEFTMFLVAGMFSYVFVNSTVSGKFIDVLNVLFGSSSLVMSIVLALIIILTGIIGLHPAVMLTIFVTALKPELIGLTPIYYGALLLGSVGIANTISSGTAVNNLLANEFKLNLFTVSYRWNRLYALISFIILLLYLQWFVI